MNKLHEDTSRPLGQAASEGEEEFVELLTGALRGDVERDVDPNKGDRFDDAAMQASRAAFRAYLDSDLFSELQSL